LNGTHEVVPKGAEGTQNWVTISTRRGEGEMRRLRNVTAAVGGFAIATTVALGTSVAITPNAQANGQHNGWDSQTSVTETKTTTTAESQGNSGHPPNPNASPNNNGTATTTTTTTTVTTTTSFGPKGQIKNGKDANVDSTSTSTTSTNTSSSGPGNSQH
jgi:hypothetical protein